MMNAQSKDCPVGMTSEPAQAGSGVFYTPGGEVMAKNAIENVLKIQEQYEQARKAAVQEIQAQIKELNDQLRSLGVDSGNGVARKAAGTRQKSEAPCSVCGFKTNPPHDARAHRSQGKKKEAFNKAHLDERGLAKV